MDSLADDLETEMDTPTEPVSPEEANLEADLAADNPEVADAQQQTMEDIKNEDQMLKDKIQARIETANQEIIGFAEPAILIPYENSINGDQEENANFLESHDAAVVMNESKLKKETLVGTLVYLANNIERRAEISNNLKNLRKKDPAKKFADIIEETI